MLGKVIKFSLIFLVMALSCTACSKDHKSHNKIIDPNTVFTDIAGTKFTLKDYRGKWVLINYSASWCQYCEKEIPELNQFFRNHMHDVMVFGVNYDHVDKDKLEQIVQKMNIEFPVLDSDPKAVLHIKEVPGLPATFVIDPEGRLSLEFFGPVSQQKLEDELQLAHVTDRSQVGFA